MEIQQIRKRDGRLVEFDKAKVFSAIFRAMQATGRKDRHLAKALAEKVIEKLESATKADHIFAVEEIQDIVENVLIEEGQARVAKGYILYRQQRAQLRREKKLILEKEGEIDEVDKAFDINALKVLKARYLRKDDTGRLIESPKELFTRVATHVGMANLLYDKHVFSKTGNEIMHETEIFNPVSADRKFSVGKYKLNQYHLEALKRLYDRLNSERKMKMPWNKILEWLKEGKFDHCENDIDDFYNLMISKRFLPNTPAIANFGSVLGMGSACFVMDIGDSMESIMETLKQASMIFKGGGGLGYNFSKLRSEGDFVSTTSGVASGPLSFMRLYDTMTDVIKQGGIRRGGNMGILNINHPDIEKFIKAKEGNKAMKNFNISVLVMPDFWEHYEKNEPYPLISPKTGEVMRHVNPRMLFDMIVYQAWESAEPGVIFYDTVNKYNPFLKTLGPVVATNVCGEVLLYPNEACNLGSINVWNFVQEDESGNNGIDWKALEKVIKLATVFLDNVIDINKFPLKQIEEMTLNTRKIGLGIMGIGDLLYEIGLPYNSDEGREFMEKITEFVNYHSKIASVELAKERGSFPYYDKSFYTEGMMPVAGFENKEKWHHDWSGLSESVKANGIRNGFTIVMAPTGSISMIAGCSSGIEPVYTLVFEKHVKVGSFYYIDPVFEKAMKEEGLYDEALLDNIAENHGNIQNTPYIPKKMKKVFVTAMDISSEDHIKALASFQKWVDSSISKTINFPASATVEDMHKNYFLAYKLGCKGATVFRDKSLKEQVLVAPEKHVENGNGEVRISTPAQPRQNQNNNKLTNCPICDKALAYKEGCMSCEECGWGLCH